jgi:malonate transporter
VAAFPNTGFMGVPLLVALLGPSAAGPVICAVLADLFVTSSVCIAVAQAHSAVEHGARVAALRALRSTVSNPLPWSIALGGLFSVAGLQLPAEVQSVVNMLADAATPVALFTIGAVLWRAGQHVSRRTPVRDYAPVALVKLFVHPLLVFALAAAAHQPGRTAVQLPGDGADAGCRAAQRQQRLAAGRTLRRRQRPRGTHHHDEHGAGLRQLPLLAWLFGVRPG